MITFGLTIFDSKNTLCRHRGGINETAPCAHKQLITVNMSSVKQANYSKLHRIKKLIHLENTSTKSNLNTWTLVGAQGLL